MKKLTEKEFDNLIDKAINGKLTEEESNLFDSHASEFIKKTPKIKKTRKIKYKPAFWKVWFKKK